MSNLISLNDYREKRQQLELVRFIPLAEGVPTGKVLIPIKMHRIFHQSMTGGVHVHTVTISGGKFWHSKGADPSPEGASIPPVSDR